eukprot:gene6595-13350_t
MHLPMMMLIKIFIVIFVSANAKELLDNVPVPKSNLVKPGVFGRSSFRTSSEFLSTKQKKIDDMLLSGNWVLEHNTLPTVAIPDFFNSRRWSTGTCANSTNYVNQKYIWKSNNPLYKNNLLKDDVCNVVNGRNILIVGDSISNEFYITFVSAMGAVYPRTNMDKKSLMSTSTVLCPDGANFDITYVQNVYIEVVPKVRCNSTAVLFNQWMHLIKEKKISVLLLNRGAHFTADNIVLKELTRTFGYLYSYRDSLSVIYRDTPRGHPNCMEYFNSTPVSIKDQRNDKSSMPYRWESFNRQNSLARNLIATRFPWISYMGVVTSTLERPDSHVARNNCIHYCIPGPIDHWVPKFINLLNVTS